MRDLRYVTAGLSLEAAAEACGVDVRTFRRWETDNRAPLAVQKLLVFLSGELMHLDPQFKGFRLRDGKLFHDQAPYGITLGEIRAVRWIIAERDELRLSLKRLQHQAEAASASLATPAHASIDIAAREADTPRAASGLVYSSTSGTLPSDLFIHKARNADIAPSACIDISSTTGRASPILAPKGTPSPACVYTTKHKPRYGSVGVYRQHKRPENEAGIADGENRRGIENPISTTGRAAWSKRVGHAAPAHAGARAGIHAARNKGHATQEAPGATTQAQAPLTPASSVNNGQRSESERPTVTQRNALPVPDRNMRPGDASAQASSTTAPLEQPSAGRGSDVLQGNQANGEGVAPSGGEPRLLALPSVQRDGLQRKRLDDRADGENRAPRNPQASANEETRSAHVCSQSTHDSAPIRQQYTLCAVSDEVSSSQAPDSSTEIDITPRISGYQGALSVTPKHGSMYDLRFVHAGLSLEAAAEACGVDVRTFRRWETDNRAPLAVQKLLVFLSGELMYLDPVTGRDSRSGTGFVYSSACSK